MQHSYFTQQLLNKGLDLNLIYPEKQIIAKESLNVNYNLPQIVKWMRDSTADFRESSDTFIQLDNNIKEMVYNYFVNTKQVNPFIPITKEQIEQDIQALEVMVSLEPENKEYKDALDGLKLYLQLEFPEPTPQTV